MIYCHAECGSGLPCILAVQIRAHLAGRCSYIHHQLLPHAKVTSGGINLLPRRLLGSRVCARTQKEAEAGWGNHLGGGPSGPLFPSHLPFPLSPGKHLKLLIIFISKRWRCPPICYGPLSAHRWRTKQGTPALARWCILFLRWAACSFPLSVGARC